MNDLLDDPPRDCLGQREKAARVNRAFRRTFWITGGLGMLYVWVVSINALARQWRPANDWLAALLLLHVLTPVGFLMFGLGPAFVASIWTGVFPESFLGRLPGDCSAILVTEWELSAEMAATARQREHESRVFRRVFWICGLVGSVVATGVWLPQEWRSLPAEPVALLLFGCGMLVLAPVGIILFGLGPALLAMAWIQLASGLRHLSRWFEQRQHRRRGR